MCAVGQPVDPFELVEVGNAAEGLGAGVQDAVLFDVVGEEEPCTGDCREGFLDQGPHEVADWFRALVC